NCIREAADQLPAWFPLAMDLALVTGQRREDITNMRFSENPPTFHEVRSLAGRLYKETCGEEFAQRLLGHTSEKTTKMYLDEREKTYLLL
ncbi:tyrosine-type recombinase/integrase, partial [Shigella boydii]|nr:tyrosine-type recombinase/integrase [Shigella boydii]